MNVGDCFMMSVPPKYDLPHLWIVIAAPTPEDESILAVNVTSDEIRAGREFVLNGGDHGRIKHESFVSFSDALLIPMSSIKRLSGILITTEKPMHFNLVNQIIVVAKRTASMSDEKKTRL